MADLAQLQESDDEKVAIVECLNLMPVAVTDGHYFADSGKRDVIVLAPKMLGTAPTGLRSVCVNAYPIV